MSILLLQLIRVCSEHGQAVTALSVYDWMKAPASVGGAGLAPTVYTYTAAMRAALSAGLLDRALQIWADAQAAECPLDCRLCITYIEVRGSPHQQHGACSAATVILLMYTMYHRQGPAWCCLYQSAVWTAALMALHCNAPAAVVIVFAGVLPQGPH